MEHIKLDQCFTKTDKSADCSTLRYIKLVLGVTQAHAKASR